MYLWSALAVIAGLLSLLFVWMEVTIVAPDRPNLSPVGAWIDSLRPEQDGRATVVGLLFFAILNGYTLFSLFRVHIFNYYKMSSPNQTDTNSMLVNASFLLRLLFPLGYNFIQLLHLKGTTFSRVIDQMDIVPFLGSKFTAIAPMMIAVFCLATLFNLYSRILKMLHITRFEYGSVSCTSASRLASGQSQKVLDNSFPVPISLIIFACVCVHVCLRVRCVSDHAFRARAGLRRELHG